MSEKRRALGRGLGALIPAGAGTDRPVDVFFRESPSAAHASVDRGEADSPLSTKSRADEHSNASLESDDTAPGGRSGHTEGGANTPASTPDSADMAVEGSGLVPVPGADFAELPVGSIRPNPRQPRTVFDEDAMAELVHSISEIGVLQPIVVRPLSADDAAEAGSDEATGEAIRYELIMGERRWRASREAGKDAVPAIIRATEDDDLLRDALLENLHRSQLNALEEAAAYQQLLDDFGCTQEELATRIGRSRPQISNTLRLLKLPPPVARRVAAGVLSAGHARAVLALPDGAAMERMAQRIVAEGLSVRSVEELVSLGGDEGKPVRRKPRAGGRHPQLDDLAADLSDQLETRVQIALGQRKGKLTVEFASVEDLHRIVAAMGLTQRD